MAELPPTPRDYYAAERTLLAWIRTALAIMGLGFVVARFGIFLREIRTSPPSNWLESVHLSAWFGITLILFGIAINILAVRRYRTEFEWLNAAAVEARATSNLALWTAFGLAALGGLMALYLTVLSVL
jgi:putative membrane protein